MPAENSPSPSPAWHVYIVRCRDRSLYTGITTDLHRRLTEHNGGRGAKYTRTRLPVILVYSERAASRAAAARREYQIKRLSPAGKRELIAASVIAFLPSTPKPDFQEKEHLTSDSP